MKIRTQSTFALFIAMLCIGFTAHTQSSNDEILNNVKNLGDYTTFEVVSMDKDLSTFANFVALSGLAVSMQLAEGHTLFVPTNAAFDEMTIERYTSLTDPKNKSELIQFVKNHVMPTKHSKSDFKNDQVITTPDNNEISVSKNTFDNVFISGSRIIKSDIEASNGVIHIVNGVIDPNMDLVMN